jgi:hypothetical protein
VFCYPDVRGATPQFFGYCAACLSLAIKRAFFIHFINCISEAKLKVVLRISFYLLISQILLYQRFRKIIHLTEMKVPRKMEAGILN